MQKITYYSLIKEAQVTQALMRGTLKALLGVVLMFFGGPFFFIPALLIIGWGLLPYRKIKKLQLRPEMLHLTKDHLLLKDEIIPLKEICKMEYLEGDRFGILIFTKDRTHFAPYFSKRVFDELTEQDDNF